MSFHSGRWPAFTSCRIAPYHHSATLSSGLLAIRSGRINNPYLKATLLSLGFLAVSVCLWAGYSRQHIYICVLSLLEMFSHPHRYLSWRFNQRPHLVHFSVGNLRTCSVRLFDAFREFSSRTVTTLRLRAGITLAIAWRNYRGRGAGRLDTITTFLCLVIAHGASIPPPRCNLAVPEPRDKLVCHLCDEYKSS